MNHLVKCWLLLSFLFLSSAVKSTAWGVDYWWHGDTPDSMGDTPGFNWGVSTNWSLVDSVANGGPVEPALGVVPGAGDIVHWAFSDPDPEDPLLRSNVTRNIIMGGPRQIATFVHDGTVVTKTFPFIDNFDDPMDPNAGVQSLTLTGSTRDLTGGFTMVPNVIFDIRRSTTFAPKVKIEVPGDQTSVIHSHGGTQLRLRGSLTTGPNANLRKLGFDSFRVGTDAGDPAASIQVSGTLELVQGTFIFQSRMALSSRKCCYVQCLRRSRCSSCRGFCMS